MKKMLLYGMGVLVWLALISNLSKSSYVSRTPTAQELSTVDKFETRDWFITVKQGANGPIYFVEPKNKKIIPANLSHNEFQNRYPELIRALPFATPKHLRPGHVVQAAVGH